MSYVLNKSLACIIQGGCYWIGEQLMKVVSFKLEDELLEILEEYSKKRNVTKSEIIRRALQNYIMADKDKPFVTKRIKIYT